MDFIKYAKEVEERALNSYVHNMGILRLQGMSVEDIEEIVKKVSIDTLIHEEVMAELFKAFEKSASRVMEILREAESITLTKAEKVLLVEILRDHLLIESDMIETYRKLAQEQERPVLKAIAEALAKNEEEHHKMVRVNQKYEET